MRRTATSPTRTLLHLPVIGLFLLISLMTPMLSLIPASAAQGDENQCEPGLILDEQTGECVADPGEPQQPACAEGEILDPATGQCSTQPPACAEGETLDPATNQCIPQQPTCAEGELLDPNTGECFVPPAGARQRGSESLPICNEGEALDHDTLECVPLDPEPPVCADVEFLDTSTDTCLPPASFALYKYWCPPGFDASQASLDVLRNTCSNNNAESISWTLQLTPQAGIDPGEAVTGTYGSTSYASEIMPPGHLTVTELPTAGYGLPVVFCDRPQGEPSGTGPFTRWSVSNDASIGADLQAGGSLSCYWFSVPLTTEPAQIVIEKYWCPADLAGTADATLADLMEACQEPPSEATFLLAGGNQEWPEKSPQGGPPASVSWDNLPPGHNYTVTESTTSSVQPPVVFCHESANQPVKVDASTGSVSWTAIASATWTCAWFNLADAPVAKALIVQKYTCPDGPPALSVVPTVQGDCASAAGIEFTATYGGTTLPGVTGDDGVVRWEDVPDGPWTIQETIPAGYGEPTVVCGHLGDTTFQTVQVTDGRIEGNLDASERDDYCLWYNVPLDTTTVLVRKYACPEGVIPEETYESYRDLCTEGIEGVEFTLDTALVNPTRTTNPAGSVEWSGDVPVVPFTLTETVPPGYGDPVWWCTAEFGPGFESARTGNSIEIALDAQDGEYYCIVFNMPEQPAEITIHKWTCPAGYDPAAHGADPSVDCAEATDGVTFTLDQQPEPHLQGTTGETIPGAVYFGGLPPGDYTITETVPEGTASQFVWDCVGTSIDAVHPMPLSTGDTLAIDVASGDTVTCNWYNVPRPEHGSVAVTKYACWTPTFTSEVDCQVHEGGASFELLGDDGTTSVGTGTTGPGGTYTWHGIEAGHYTLRELDGVPCHISGANNDGHITVVAGETTTVSIFNCDIEPAGEAPIRYPNTGAAPTGVMPAIQRGPSAPATPAPGVSAASFHDITCLDAPITVDGTPAPAGTPPGDPTCLRGAIPKRLVIVDAGVDADIEVIEIVDGIMKDPSGPEIAGWYKETPRLGEPGNMLIAGHLNWWHVPEGVFYRLAELETGDRIEITGDDGLTYVYEVQWVRQEDSAAPPAANVIGPTDEASLTLITCGGEWNADLAAYDERTVVRAVQVDVQPSGTAGD